MIARLNGHLSPRSRNRRGRFVLPSAGAAVLLAATYAAGSQAAALLEPDQLISALRQGGYVLVIRHASSPRELPDERAADAANVRRERQLDERGRTTATAMGEALRDLKIPVGDVLTSPTYRARETVRLAGLPNPEIHVEIGDGGESMAGVTDAHVAWLRERAGRPPKPGTNTIIVSHMPNIPRAFPAAGPEVAEGEALFLRPDGSGNASLVGRITIDEWPRLAR
jgi:phosphohistidine phosphatase SixA